VIKICQHGLYIDQIILLRSSLFKWGNFTGFIIRFECSTCPDGFRNEPVRWHFRDPYPRACRIFVVLIRPTRARLDMAATQADETSGNEESQAPPPSHDSVASTTLIPNSAVLRRLLSRLPKSAIIDLVLIWLQSPLCPIDTPDQENYFAIADETLQERMALYEACRDKSVIKKSIIDRILENEWVQQVIRLC
jgi:Kinetochore protein CHL4 like